jgi:hypothetical protein
MATRRNRSGNKPIQAFSAGSYTTRNEASGQAEDPAIGEKIRLARKAGKMHKTADYFAGPTSNAANISDSNNIGYYSYEFPVDSLELPQSRAQELRYYRLAYDRDPIVGRGIDLHTEIPMSKITLERPKCSSEEFGDYVFDFFQSLVTNSRMFETLLHASREYWTIGEAFLYVEDDPDIRPSKAAQGYVDRGNKDEMRNAGTGLSGPESYNQSWGSDDLAVMSSLLPNKRSSITKFSKVAANIAAITKTPLETTEALAAEIKRVSALIKKAKIVTRKMADEPATPVDAPPADAPAGDIPDADSGEGDDAMGSGGDLDFGGSSSAPSGGGGLMPLPDPNADFGMEGEDGQMPVIEDKETRDMKNYLSLLKKKKDLLEELKMVRQTRENDITLFKHICNKDYTGFDKIQLLPPENIEIRKATVFGEDSTIFYKPPEDQKAGYIEDPNTPDEVKESLQADGLIPLNDDPFKGSYCLHFARKKAPFEDHGRSILQRCMRTIIYREKLRQVQTTLASRNMTPKTFIVAPGISPNEVLVLRAHADEAKSDPDYTIVVNYEARWDEIGSEGRLLSLDTEWAHTANDLAIGLGFSPDILNGEGLYSGTKIQLEILSTTYVQYRDLISYIVQELIFKPIAMKKGFYEDDKYGRPRWIYPTVSFGRMALRNSGDTYQMLFDLYQKGSLPVSIILELLDVDPEACKKALEADLFSVNDSKFNAFLESLYASIGADENLKKATDLMDRIRKTLGLKEKEIEDAEIEGSGEGL